MINIRQTSTYALPKQMQSYANCSPHHCAISDQKTPANDICTAKNINMPQQMLPFSCMQLYT